MFTNDIDKLVEEIARRETKPVIDKSIEQIVAEIATRTGRTYSKKTIWLSLQRIGAKASGRKFVYRHNEGKAE
jgi:hypothetical protein